MSTITTLEALQNSATTYAKDLLMMPATGAKDTLQHMTGIPNLKGNHVFGQLDGSAELGPYKSTRKASGDFKITPRELVMHLGNTAIEFDPNEVWGTIYGSLIARGESLKNVDIAKNILLFVGAKLGKNLNMAIWNAKYNASGDKTTDLFDGFDTITEAEVTATNLSTDNGNYIEVEAMTSANAIELLQKIYDACDDELKGQACKIYCTKDVYTAYCRNYQLLHGALPYNTEYKKTYLEGSDDLFEFCPLSSKKGSKYIHIAPKGNMVYGYGAGQYPGEQFGVEKYSSWMLTAEAAMAFGCQFRSLSKEMLMVAKVGE